MDIKQISYNDSTYQIKDGDLWDMIAEEYSTQKSYEEGDFCLYNGGLYKCVSETSGAWDQNKWESTVVMEEIKNQQDSGYELGTNADWELMESVMDRNYNGEIESSNVREIIDYAFQRCSSLTSVSFPNCNVIGAYAFLKCSSLINAIFPNCTIIESNAFTQCTSLTSIYFPNCITIGNYAFYEYQAKNNTCVSIYFPKCKIIGSDAFKNNYKGPISIDFPECEIIGSYAFQKCSSLTTVSLPNCKTLNNGAFEGCNGLRTISLPKCNFIGAYCFQNVNFISSLYLLNSQVCTLAHSNVFNQYYYLSIYVPSSLLNEYKNATNWNYYSKRFVGI